jgi:DNA-binding NtrC family response regulator
MISGHGNIHTRDDATQIRGVRFIEKPLSLDALLLTVQRFR